MKTQGETEKSSNTEGTLTMPLSSRKERGMDTGEGERDGISSIFCTECKAGDRA